MKALFIGGTGTISTAIVQRLSEDPAWEVWVLNRAKRSADLPAGVHQIICDISDEADAAAKLEGMEFDVVSEFIGFTVDQVERDYRLFSGKTKQYIYISSASAYHKPSADYVITEGTALANSHWEYSRNKIACEEFLMEKYRSEGFPVTIVRPSHTYDEKNVPLGVHGKKGFYQVIKRMLEGKEVIIQGDGTSLWTVTFNKDFAVGYTALMGNRHAIGEAFQITSDETLSWNQIYQTIADALGVELHACHISSEFLSAAGEEYGFDFEGSLIGDKAVSVVFDNSKLKRIAPDMKTTVRFDQGVRIALDHVLSHPECQVEDPEFDEWCDRVIAARAQALEKRKPELTTLCYLEKDGKYLMLHRVKKQNDLNKDKYIGVGGHFEWGESPDECLKREVEEETGLTLTSYRPRGLVTFVYGDPEDRIVEYMHLYTASEFTGQMKECDEGELVWIDKEKAGSLPIWEGDKIFFRLLSEREDYFSLKLVYSKEDELIEVSIDGE